VGRRLSAIMLADVVGYSRLLGENEAGTLDAIREHKLALIDPLIAKFGSRLVRQIGDAILVDFASAVEAVQCAVGIQKGMVERNRTSGERPKIQFRTGLDLGEIVIQDDNVFGDTVNVAARLQELAEPNGICITERMHEEIVGKVDYSFAHLGELQLKNIVHPVRVFKWVSSGSASKSNKRVRAIPWSARIPSIAVLQFNAGAEDTFIGNGLVEDITMELGRFSDLLVIASESALLPRDQTMNPTQIGHELGAQFLVKGSIRRSGEKFGILANLFNGSDGALLWSNKYSGDFSDLFAIQTDVANDIAASLPSRIEKSRLDRALRKPTESLDAYECYLRGRALYRQKSRTHDANARELLERATEIDPDFADPYAIIGAIIGSGWSYSKWGIDPKDRILKGRKRIRKALSLNRSLPSAHAHLGWNLLYTGEFAQARQHMDEAERLNPNDPNVLTLRAYALCYLGEPEQALRLCRRLMRLNPRYPDWYLDILATAQFLAMQYEEAVATLQSVPEFFPENAGWAAAAYAHLGRMDEATDFARRFIQKIRPIWKGSISATPPDYVSWMLHVANPFARAEDRDNLADGLKKCGLRVDRANQM
jgi:adenylate cyclase